MKQSRAINNPAAFFPNYFKKIGLGLIVISVAILIVARLVMPDMPEEDKDVCKTIFFNILILGLFFVAWSKDKFEDEMTMQIRLRTVGFAFMTSIFYVIFSPLVDLVFNFPASQISAHQVLMFMLFMYIISYRTQKRAA